MALTDTRPETDASEALDASAAPAPVDAFLGSGDHKTTGRLWIGAGSLMLLAGLAISLVAAIEHVDLGGFSIVDSQGHYTQLWSLGRELLFFGGLVPLFVGLATYVVPLQVGSSSLAFPRGAAAAFWSWLVSTGLLIVAYIMNGGPGGGRSDYVVMWTVALAAMVVSLIWAMICVATTVLGARTTGMSLDRIPVSTWSFFVFCLGGLFSLPIVLAQLLMAYLDVKYGFLADRESRTVLLGVSDSVMLAPALFWLGIPVLGIGVEAIGVHTGSPLRFRRSIMVALATLGIVSFAADTLAFSSRGRPIDFHNGVLVAGLLASALPVLAALALAGDSLKSGSFKLRTPLVAGLLGGFLFLLGAASGVLGAVWPTVTFIEDVFDTDVSLDSAFDLSGTSFHDGLRGVMVGAAALGVIAGVHHWGHKIWGRSLDDRLGLLSALVAAGGGVLWGVGGIAAGFLEQPRQPLAAVDVKDGVEALNGVTVAGIALLVLAALLLLANVARTAFGGGSSNEPWRGLTLEWATASPPEAANFDTPPVVTSALPLLDAVAYRSTADESDRSEDTADEEGKA